MIDHQNDPHLQHLLAHSDELRRRSREANRKLERTSARIASLSVWNEQQMSYMSELLAHSAPMHLRHHITHSGK